MINAIEKAILDSGSAWKWLYIILWCLIDGQHSLWQAKREALLRLRGRVSALEVEKMESEYQIRQEVCREFQEQLTDIEEAHRSVRGGREGVCV